MKPPRRYKKTSFWICLILGLIYLFFAWSKAAAANVYESEGWLVCLLLSAIFLAAAVLLFLRNRASDRAWDEVERCRAEADMMNLEKLRAERDQHDLP